MTKLALLSLVAAFALPGSAAGETVVPPGNPAATQYTEAVPTSHGPADSEHGPKHKHSPRETLGEHDAQKLEAEGEAGREAARVAAETAPEGAVAANSGGAATAASGQQQGDGGRPAGGPAADGQGSGAGPGPEPDGGSAAANVAGQATGLSGSEATGLLLPLLLLAATAGAIAYFVRQRRRAER